MFRPRRPDRASDNQLEDVISPLGGIHLTGLVLVSGSPGSGGRWAGHAPRSAPGPGRDGWGGLGRAGRDQVAVAHWVVGHGELKDPVERQPAGAGPAPVETEHE